MWSERGKKIQGNEGRTNVWWECNCPAEREEEKVGSSVDRITAVDFGKRSHKQRPNAQAEDV